VVLPPLGQYPQELQDLLTGIDTVNKTLYSSIN